MRLLLVEDDPEKTRAIQEALSTALAEGATLQVASDLWDARRRLAATWFDVLILDIALPERKGEEVKLYGGVELLRELLERPHFKIPGHVVGLTAHEDVFEDAAREFSSSLLTVLRFSESQDVWSRPLQRLVRNVLAAKTAATEPKTYRAFLGVICALQSPEFESVLDIPWSWKAIAHSDDFVTYYEGEMPWGDQTGRVIAACAGRKGMASAGVLASKMISLFRPQFLVMTGITAGLRGKANLGDVIAAEMCWDYGSGKIVGDGTAAIFKQAPYQISVRPDIRDRLNRLAADTTELAKIEEHWRGPKPASRLTVRVGPVASGAAVLADVDISTGVQTQHREVVGIEMEVYGVFVAAEEGLKPSPKAFSLKGVVDFADAEKNDDFQSYGSYTSAMTMRLFAEKYLSTLI
jgi:nucleoside phosphorylase